MFKRGCLLHPALAVVLLGVGFIAGGTAMQTPFTYSRTLPIKGKVWTVVLRHVDGDTVQIGSIVDEGTARLLDIDAPEVRAKTQKERDLADAATARLVELLPVNSVWRTEVGGRDGFGRPLVRFVREDGTTVNRQMIDEGHAKEYRR